MRVLSTEGLLNLETMRPAGPARSNSLDAAETAHRVLKRWARRMRLFCVIPGRLEEANPESRDSGFGATHRPGM